ncbi:hypothetical protein [Enterobacter sp. PTB]|uniref:hypothetical protein n=1 Tax=Enterobacter sp. PTB TaxID=3143437 RepID=UPI003DA7FA20
MNAKEFNQAFRPGDMFWYQHCPVCSLRKGVNLVKTTDNAIMVNGKVMVEINKQPYFVNARELFPVDRF